MIKSLVVDSFKQSTTYYCGSHHVHGAIGLVHLLHNKFESGLYMHRFYFWAGLLFFLYSASASAAKPVISLLESRQRNVVVQQWDLSCGAAALSTILRFQHGLDVLEKDIAIDGA